MATGLKTFTPPTERAAEILAQTGGTVMGVANGHLTRVGVQVGWNINTPWEGPEVVRWTHRASLWTKMIEVRFSTETPPGGVVFILSLKPPLSPEDIALSADTHMMLLNLARKEV
jgi:hypothetical protein